MGSRTPSRTALPSPGSSTRGGAPSTGDIPPQSLGSLKEEASLSHSKGFRREPPELISTPLLPCQAHGGLLHTGTFRGAGRDKGHHTRALCSPPSSSPAPPPRVTSCLTAQYLLFLWKYQSPHSFLRGRKSKERKLHSTMINHVTHSCACA